MAAAKKTTTKPKQSTADVKDQTAKTLDLKDEAVQEQFLANPNVPVEEAVDPTTSPPEGQRFTESSTVATAPEQAPVQTQQEEAVPDPVSIYGSPYGRRVQAKAVLYTDGISGEADQNHERAYEYAERLQSNDPVERKAGDVSLSEAAQELRSEEDKREAEEVARGSRVNN